MNSFTVYTQDGCIFCTRAIELLQSKDQAVNVININEGPVPQIYHNGKHVGGYDDLVIYLGEQSE